MTSCLCRGKADAPWTNENTLSNPTRLERSKERFFPPTKNQLWVPQNSRLAPDRWGHFSTGAPLSLSKETAPRDRHVSLSQIECSQSFPQGHDHSEPGIRSLSPFASSPYVAPGLSKCPGSSSIRSDDQYVENERLTSLIATFLLNAPFKISTQIQLGR